MTHPDAKNALVLCGGGIMGAVFEIGCLAALEETIADIRKKNGDDSPDAALSKTFDMFIGTSVGALVASLLANRVSPKTIFDAIKNDDPDNIFNFRRSDIYSFDGIKWVKALWTLFKSSRKIVRRVKASQQVFSLLDFIAVAQELLPKGIFSIRNLDAYVCRIFMNYALSNDFRTVPKELYIPSINLDTGERVIFGHDSAHQKYGNVPICKAITASAAIPFFFEPVIIGGDQFIDAETDKIAHLDIAINEHAKFIMVINPIVPLHNDRNRMCIPTLTKGICGNISDKGLEAIFSQSHRIQHHARLQLGLTYFTSIHPNVRIMVIEPESADMFVENPMSFENRVQVLELGYTTARKALQKSLPEIVSVCRHVSTIR